MPSVFDSAESSQANQTSIKDQVTGYFTKNKQMVSLLNILTLFTGDCHSLVRWRYRRTERNENGLRVQIPVMRSKMSACYLIRLDLVNK